MITVWTKEELARECITMWQAMVDRADGDLIVGLAEDDTIDWAVTGTERALGIEFVILHQADVPEDALSNQDYIDAMISGFDDLEITFPS